MYNGAGLGVELRDNIWKECVMNVTFVSNIISTKSSLKLEISNEEYLNCYIEESKDDRKFTMI
jgi:hypothetical protein